MTARRDDDEDAPKTTPSLPAFTPPANAPPLEPMEVPFELEDPPTAPTVRPTFAPAPISVLDGAPAHVPVASPVATGAPPMIDDGGLFEVTLPGDGASSLGGALTPGRFARLLMSLFAQERSGRLAVETGTPDDPGVKGTLFFLHGEPVHAVSVDAEARLLERLRERGELSDEATVDPTLPLVPTLVRRKWAQPTAILHALRDAVREFVAGALAAELGVYRFFDDTGFTDHVPLVGVSPFAMLLEQRRRAQPADVLLRQGEDMGAKYLVPQPGFANAASRLSAFTGGVDLEDVVDGTVPASAIYERTRLPPLNGGLVIGTLADAGLVLLQDEPTSGPVRDKRKAPTSSLPLLVNTDGITLVGAALPGGGDLLSLYLLLKPERDDDAILGVARDASLLEVERAFRARMAELDPSGVQSGPSRPHLLARIEELRTKVERAYQARSESAPRERVTEYEIERKLGEGGMAEVFVGRIVDVGSSAGALTTNVNQLVAIKKLHGTLQKDAKFARMFLREARLTRRVRHKNVVRILSVGMVQGDLYLAMEYVDGADLAHLLNNARDTGQAVPIELACKVIADVCGGLHAAHTAHDGSGAVMPILHRDVSPQNILVGSRGEVKLTDFGIAKVQGAQTENYTRTGFIKGKVHYLAPELIDGFPASVRTDVYAAAITLYSCLAPLPFRKKSLLLTMRAILTDPLPPISEAVPNVPPRLDEIIRRATAKDPEERHASAQALQLELEELLTGLEPPNIATWVRTLRDAVPAPAATGAPPAEPSRTGNTSHLTIVEEVDLDVDDA